MSITLTELCDVMNNWFDENSDDGTKNRFFGTYTISGGQIDLSEIGIQENQYYRIVGSVFNDGVYQYHAPVDSADPAEEPELIDETFTGAIWAMAVPKKVLGLLAEINDWEDKYGPIVASPFNSESFGGYSYYKGYKNTMSTVTTSWSSKFAEKINKWRKVRNI